MYKKEGKPFFLMPENCLAFDLSVYNSIGIMVLPKKESAKEDAFSFSASEYLPKHVLQHIENNMSSIKQLAPVLAAMAELKVDESSLLYEQPREDGLFIVRLC
jgi:hypothetical protein